MLKQALSFIKFDKAKSLGVVIGILVSTFLIGQQYGVFIFLSGLISAVMDSSDTDIWVVDPSTNNVNQLLKLDYGKAQEVASIGGVGRSYPIVITGASATFKDGTIAGVQIVGSGAPELFAGPPRGKIISGKLTDLMKDGAVSGDYFDKRNFGGKVYPGMEFEISGKRAYLAVETKGFRGFGANYLFTTIDRARYYAGMSNQQISAVLVKVKPGDDPVKIRDKINKTVYGVKAWLTKDLKKTTQATVITSGGIGISTGSLIVIAILSGFFIIGLTMYSAALDRLKDYGVMKAVGAGNAYIRKLIILQALILSLIGFIVGMTMLEFYQNAIGKIGVIFDLGLPFKIALFCVIIGIAFGGSMFAIRKIDKLEPASVFRN